MIGRQFDNLDEDPEFGDWSPAKAGENVPPAKTQTAAPTRRARLYTPDYSGIKTHDEAGVARPKAHVERERKAVRQEVAARETATSTRRRQKFEKANPERFRDVVDYATEQHNKVARERPELGLKQSARVEIPRHVLYEHHGFNDAYTPTTQERDPGDPLAHLGPRQVLPGLHDRQLPGLEDPGAAKQSERWEDIHPKRQARILAAVKQKTGHTMESLHRTFGAQVDQAHVRAHRAGYDKPYGIDFYSTGSLAQAVHRTAKETGEDISTIAAMHAHNSPNTPAVTGEGTGHERFPQDEMARAAIAHVKAGGDPQRTPRPPQGGMGYQTNLNKSAAAYEYVRSGGTMAEFGGMGPKTGDYANSFIPGTPHRLVSDLHTGGGGFHPHLGYDKPVIHDTEGQPMMKTVINHKGEEVEKPRRAKSEREMAIETSGIHALHDHVARNVAAARGISRLEEMQAAQWSEERIQRPDLRHVPLTHETAYPAKQHLVGSQFHQSADDDEHKQLGLFG